MKKKEVNRVDIKRMVQLEELRFSQYINLSGIELEYFKLAMKMPIEEIQEYINLYDCSSPKLDEIKFIIALQEKYSESRENVIKRIRQVRQIMQYEKALKEGKKIANKIL